MFVRLLLTLISSVAIFSFLTGQCPNGLVISSTAVSDVSCANGADGAIDFNEGGGVAPYTYDWSDIPGTDNERARNNLTPNIYDLTITDSEGCTVTESFLISEPPPIVLDIVISEPLCFGEASGEITVFATGGVPPYDYSWTPFGFVGPNIVGVPSGVYTVTVSDINGCTAEISAALDQPEELTIELLVENATCGLCDGLVEVIASGGTPPYSFLFNTPNDNNVNLCAGSYEASVIDANGCLITQTFEIQNEGSSNDIVLQSIVDPDFCSECQGRIALNPSCGTPPYTYTWTHDGNLNGPIADSLCAGIYPVTVTDMLGNQVFENFNLMGSSPVEFNLDVTDATCLTSTDGAVDITVVGGTAPFTFDWWDGANEEDRSNLGAVSGSVTITDGSGCTSVAAFTIGLISDFAFDTIYSTPSCNNDGTATVVYTGGTGTYQYFWSSGDTTMTATGLAPGIYDVTVSDGFCGEAIEVEVIGDVEFNVITTPANCDSLGGTATVELVGSIPNPSYSWSNNGSGNFQSDLRIGGYSVTVSDDNGCEKHQNFFIEQDSSCYVTISGFVYDDANTPDCQLDNNTLGIARAKVELSNGQILYTDVEGFYEFQVPPGVYTVRLDTSLLSQYYNPLCVDSIIVNASVPSQSYNDNNFYLEGNGLFDLNLKVNKGRPRPGRVRVVTICLMNYGTFPVSGTLTFTHDPRQEYRGANFQESSYDAGNNVVTWDFTNLAPGPVRVYRVNMYTDLSVGLGDTLRMTFHADPVSGDLNPANNTIVDCPVITVNSYDPNDKAVLPVGEGVIGRIDQNNVNELNYRVRFQNTGTDTAYTVIIRDELDEDLDPSTVVPGASSHPYILEIEDGNVLKFTFNDINLVDSFTNEPGSNGFVFFDVQLKPNLTPGTAIQNNAEIFFDFNAPIQTNTVLNTIRGQDVFTSQTLTGCGEVEYNGQTYTDDVVVVDTIPLLLYDSIVTTSIEINDTFNIYLVLTYCEGDNPVAPGIYNTQLVAQNGCDSIVITEVIVLPTTRVQIDTTIARGDEYEGQIILSDTVLVDTLMDVNGCDSIITVNISVLSTSTRNLFAGQVDIFPNPTSNEVNIVFENIPSRATQIILYDLLGQKVLERTVKGQTIKIQTEHLPRGTYLLMLRRGEEWLSKRLVLMRP